MSFRLEIEEQLLKMRGAATLIGNLYTLSGHSDLNSVCFLLEDIIKDSMIEIETLSKTYVKGGV